jgi:hypothetical protein
MVAIIISVEMEVSLVATFSELSISDEQEL